MAYAGPSSIGPTVAGAIAQGKRILPVNDKISFLEPDKAQLLRLMTPSSDGRGSIRKSAVSDMKFQWMENAGMPRWDQTSSAYSGATVTTIAVDYGTYFAAGYSVKVPRTGAIFNVVSVSGNNLTITSYNFSGTGVNAALVDNEPLLILGRTAEEGSTSGDILVVQETIPFNYIEIVETPFGVSNVLKNTSLYGGGEMDNQTFYKGIEHAIAIENRLWFGVRDQITSGTMVKWRTGGVLDPTIGITTNVTVDSGSLTETEFNTWLQTLFNYGSDKKAVFCAGDVISTLNTYGSGKVRINDMLTKKYGFDIKEWLCPFGTAYLIHNKLFTGAVYGKMAIGIDLDNIMYHYLQNCDTTLEMNIQANDAKQVKNQYLTHCGLELRLEKTHAKLTKE